MKITRFLKTVLMIDFISGLFIAIKEVFKPKKTISHAIDEIISAFRNGNLRDEPHFHNLNWMNKMTSDTRELAK